MHIATDLYHRALDAWDDGSQVLTLELTRDLLRQYPDYGAAHLLQGIILHEISRYEEAEAALNLALKYAPAGQEACVFIQFGQLNEQRGDYPAAIAWYEKAAARDLERGSPRIYLGSVYARLGDYEKAEEWHRQAAQCSNVDIDEAWLNIGLVLRAQERYEEALECFEKSLEISPDYEEARNSREDVRKALAYLAGSAD